MAYLKLRYEATMPLKDVSVTGEMSAETSRPGAQTDMFVPLPLSVRPSGAEKLQKSCRKGVAEVPCPSAEVSRPTGRPAGRLLGG